MYIDNCIKYYDLYIPFIFGPLFTLSGGYPQRDESLIPFLTKLCNWRMDVSPERRLGCAKIGSGWPRSSPAHGNTRGFSKWRFRKWRFLEVKVEGSGAEGPNKEENSGRRRFWVFQGFHRFPEGSGARLSEVPPDTWGYLCSVDPICGTPAFPGVLSCWTHSCSTGALGLLGEEVDFDWKGWQEYLVRWA